MRHRLMFFTLVAVLATAQWAAVAATLSPDRPIAKPTNLSFVMKGTGSFFNKVNGTGGPAIGDSLASHSVLMKGGRSVGHLGAACTVTGAQAVCTAVLWAQGGQIALTGQLLIGALTGDGGTVHLAVTGGTGAFRHVAGQAKIQIQPSSGRSTLTISLLP